MQHFALLVSLRVTSVNQHALLLHKLPAHAAAAAAPPAAHHWIPPAAHACSSSGVRGL